MELAHYQAPKGTNTYFLFDHVDKLQLDPLIKVSAGHSNHLILNFAKVESLDMSCLKGLVKLAKNYRKQNLRITLEDVSAKIQTYLELTQINRLFSVSPSEDHKLPHSA